ncbi:MAG: hypothetical protein AB1592_12420 [Pseudomonadota bacterium]
MSDDQSHNTRAAAPAKQVWAALGIAKHRRAAPTGRTPLPAAAAVNVPETLE